MKYTIRHWIKKEGDWTSTCIDVQNLVLARTYRQAALSFVPYGVSEQDFEIRKDGSDTWRDLEDVLDGNPPLETAEREDYVGSRENMEPVVITRTPEDWEPQAEEGYRFDLMVLQGSTGEYWRLASFWHSGPAVAAYDALQRAIRIPESEEVL